MPNPMIHIPHLETDLTTACQLSCVACNHMVPLYRGQHAVWRAEPVQVEKDLNHLATIVHADAWAAIGGEPFLHPEFIEILKIARRSRVADKLEVWTNGIMFDRFGRKGGITPAHLRDEATREPLFDTLVLSRYEGKLTDDLVDFIKHVCYSDGIELVIKDERSWRNFRTNLELVPTDDLSTRSKFSGCFFRHFSRVANQGYFYTCCCAPHMPVLIQGQPLGTDGISIDGLTEEGLNSYLTRSEPLGCCSICAGRDTAVPIVWHEERDPELWIEKSKGKEG